MKDSFIMYIDYLEALEALTTAQVGEFLLSCMEYVKTEKEPEITDMAVKVAFKMAKAKMDKDAQKWADTCEKRREAGKQGGRPKKQAEAKKANAFSEKQKKQKQAKKAECDCDCDCDSEYINNIGRSAPRFIKPSIDQVREYCDSRRNGIDPQSFIDFYDARGWKLTKGVSMKDWKAAVRTWEKNRRTDPKARGKPPEREYDFDDLEIRLLASN